MHWKKRSPTRPLKWLLLLTQPPSAGFLSLPQTGQVTKQNYSLKLDWNVPLCCIVSGHCSLNAIYMYNMLKLGLAWLFLSRKAVNISVLLRGWRKGVSQILVNIQERLLCKRFVLLPSLYTSFIQSCISLTGRGHFYQCWALSLHVWSIMHSLRQNPEMLTPLLKGWKIGWMDLPLTADERLHLSCYYIASFFCYITLQSMSSVPQHENMGRWRHASRTAAVKAVWTVQTCQNLVKCGQNTTNGQSWSLDYQKYT